FLGGYSGLRGVQQSAIRLCRGEQLPDLHLERCSDPHQVQRRDVTLPALHAPIVGTTQTCPVRKILLREAMLLPDLPDLLTKRNQAGLSLGRHAQTIPGPILSGYVL